MNLTAGVQVCGEQYTFDPLSEQHTKVIVAAGFTIIVNFSLITEQPEAPTVRTVRTEQPKAPVVTRTTEEQTSISLLWEVSKTCFDSVDFTVNISWRCTSGNGQVTNVSGSSYDITGLTPDVSYHITLVAIGNGVRSDNISISATTLSRGESTVHVVSCMRDEQVCT